LWGQEVGVDDALELLGPGFTDKRVRAFAVKRLERADDDVGEKLERRTVLTFRNYFCIFFSWYKHFALRPVSRRGRSEKWSTRMIAVYRSSSSIEV
jgi:hypothetical protein